MTNESRAGDIELDLTDAGSRPVKPRTPNLGSAILMAAIEDYRSMDEQAHENAEQFLYPKTPEWRDQYEWAVALAAGINAAWLRGALDRARDKWDGQRLARMTARTRRAAS